MRIRNGRMSLYAVLVAALVAAACSARPGVGTPAPPPATAPAASQVTAAALPGVTATLWQSDLPDRPPTPVSTGHVVPVGLGVLQIDLQFDAPPHQGSVASGLTFRSSRPDQLQDVIPDMRWVRSDRLEVRVPPGPAGEQLLLRLEAGIAAPFALTLLRQAALQYQFTVVGYPVRWPDPLRTTMPVRVGTTTVEVVFSGPVDRLSVEAALEAALRPPPQSAPSPSLTFHWESDARLRLDLDGTAFAAATVDPGAARDQAGRSLARQEPLRLVWMPPTRLTAIEPGGADPWVLGSTYIKPAAALLSPDGNGVAFLEQQGARLLLWMLDRRDGVSQPLHTELRDPRLLYWSPDSQSLIVGAPDRVLRIQVRNGSSAVLYQGPYVGMAPSPDGQRLAVLVPQPLSGADRFELLVVGATSRSTAAADLRLVQAAPTGGIPISWHRDGRWLALGAGLTRADRVLLMSVEGGQRELTLAAPIGAGPLVWSPDGERLLAGTAILEPQSGRSLRRLTTLQGLAQWRHDGRSLLVGGSDGPVSAIQFSSREPAGNVADVGIGTPAGWLPTGHMVIFR